MIPIDFITLYNRIDFRFWFSISSSQEPSIVSTTFHHNCKICQLICSLVYIQSMNIMLYNLKRCFSLVISGAFIDIHQYIKHSAQDMSTSHAWINTGNVCWFQVFICSTDFRQFYINSLFLLCFWKIIFPSKFLCCCLQPCNARSSPE